MTIREISSPYNLYFKKWKKLLVAKGIKEERLFLVSGEKIVREFSERHRKSLVCEILDPDLNPLTGCEQTFRLSRNLFQQLDVFKTHAPLLVCSVPDIPFVSPRLASSGDLKGLTLILPLSDPHNLGSALRSAEAFAVDQVILTDEAAHPFLPKAVRAAAGSNLRIPIYRTKSLKELEGDFFALSGEEGPSAQHLHQVQWPDDTILVVGEEGQGLKSLFSSHLARLTSVQIPTQGVESLNAGVALGIALYSIRQYLK